MNAVVLPSHAPHAPPPHAPPPRGHGGAPDAHATRAPNPRGVLHRFLSLAGKNPRLPAIAGVLDDAAPMEEIAERFTIAGVPARALRIEAADIPFLPVPALVRTRAGAHAVLRDAGSTKSTVELAPGKLRELPNGDIVALLDGSALVLGTSVSPRKATAFAHWFAIVRSSPEAMTSLRRIVVLSLVLFALGVATPLVTRFLVDTALPNIEHATLTIIVVITLVVAFHRGIANLFRERALLFVDTFAESEFLRVVFDRLLRAPLVSRKTQATGELQQILASAQFFSTDLAKGLITPLFDACLSLGYLVALAWLAPAFALAALVATFIYLGLALVLSRRVRELQNTEIEAQAVERDALLQLIRGLPTLRVFGAEDFALRTWRRALTTYQKLTVRRADAESLSSHTLESVERITMGGLLMGGAWMCLHANASTGDLLAAMGALGAYGTALNGFAAAVIHWSQLGGHTDRLAPTLSAPLPRATPSGSATPGRPARANARRNAAVPSGISEEDAIVIDRVWFRHDEHSPWLLQDFSMRIPRGAIAELKWPSGCGKSTLLRMLAGLITPQHGTIAIERMDPAHARDHVLYLPQEAHLFGGTVLENLRLLSGGASRDRLLRAAETTGLASIVASWPMGYDTVIASRGTNVSGGQRQLILLSAAIASERAILLLDESLANVDRIQRAMIHDANLFAGRTVVSVVHDGVKGLATE